MKEALGNTEAVRSLKHYGWGAYKLSDVRGSRFTETKPCDVIACSPKGRYVAIEGKMIKRWEGLSKDALRPNQVIELDGASIRRKGRSFVFLYLRIKADPKKGLKRVLKLVVLDWNTYRDQLLTVGIPVSALRDQSIGVWLDPLSDRDGKIIWPIKNLLSL
jgi:hypothetical protein